MPALCALLEFLETNDLFQLCMFGSFRHVKITDDPFDDNVGNSDVETPGKTPLNWTVSSKYFLCPSSQTQLLFSVLSFKCLGW